MLGSIMFALLMVSGASAAGGQSPDANATQNSPEQNTDATEQNARQAANAADGEEDLDRIICRSPRPVLGSRIRTRRDCMTVGQWRAHAESRRAMRRDMDTGADPVTVTKQ